MDWLSLLKLCSQRMRGEVLALFGAAEASVGFGVGAGGDVVKEIDLAAERALTKTLEEHGVSCTVVSEDSGVMEIGSHPSDFYVVTDPVDGTTNAVRGIPFTATSIAVSKAPRLRAVETALVTDLFHNVTYTAEKGRGAFKNGERIRPSSTSSLEKAVVGIDFNTFKKRELFIWLEEVLNRARHLRHLGANALELCYVADGTTDAFLDLRGKLRVTDIAGAYLILRETGGLMVTPDGTELDAPLTTAQRVAFIATANVELYEAIKGLLASTQRQPRNDI